MNFLYNVQSWIDENFELVPGGDDKDKLVNWSKGSVEVAYEKGLLTERVKNEIRKKQEWTYDKAVELGFEKEKENWLRGIEDCNSDDLSEIIKEEIDIYTKKLESPMNDNDIGPHFDNNKAIINELRKGIKFYKHIKGSEYLKVKEQYERFENKQPYEVVSLEYSHQRLAYLCKFINFLKQEKEKCQPAITEKEKEGKSSVIQSRKTLKQIALQYAYEDKYINEAHANEIAALHGHKSGKKLLQHFYFYAKQNNRKAKTDPYTKKMIKNKIELFESILSFLPEAYKNKALDDINYLKNLFENDFE